MRGTGKRAPPGNASQLRRLAHSAPGEASALILAALELTRGERTEAATGLRDAGLLAQGPDAYRALCRVIEALPGLRETIETRWPSAPVSELGGAAELAEVLREETARLRAAGGQPARVATLAAHVARLAMGEGERAARQAVRRITLREKSG